VLLVIIKKGNPKVPFFNTNFILCALKGREFLILSFRKYRVAHFGMTKLKIPFTGLPLTQQHRTHHRYKEQDRYQLKG
jgi:hypothetical protein